jgi:WD40 repeat protein
VFAIYFADVHLIYIRLDVMYPFEFYVVTYCCLLFFFFHSDGETFISADDLRINLWNLEISNQSFNIIDVKPTNMEDLTEVITSAEFHPTHCNTLAYSSSKGSIRLVDLRQSALCDTHSQVFEQHEAPGSRSFFTEIIASISDIKFSKDGRHILSRDYMTLKVCTSLPVDIPVLFIDLSHQEALIMLDITWLHHASVIPRQDNQISRATFR